jgi:putative ABC transport system ATP-binding protein
LQQATVTNGSGAAIRLEGARFAWKRQDTFALAIDNLEILEGRKVLLVGPSGSGKSTLLGLVGGTLVAQDGSVNVLGQALERMGGPARDRFRAEHIGVIFQMFNLVPYLGVIDNVLLPMSFAAGRRERVENTQGGARGEAVRLLEALGLDAETIARGRSTDLSVGQQQRVAAARALIGSPEIVIADEPTSALDRDRQEKFLKLLFAEVQRARATLVMVSHEPRFAAAFDQTIDLEALNLATKRERSP